MPEQFHSCDIGTDRISIRVSRTRRATIEGTGEVVEMPGEGHRKALGLADFTTRAAYQLAATQLVKQALGGADLPAAIARIAAAEQERDATKQALAMAEAERDEWKRLCVEAIGQRDDARRKLLAVEVEAP